MVKTHGTLSSQTDTDSLLGRYKIITLTTESGNKDLSKCSGAPNVISGPWQWLMPSFVACDYNQVGVHGYRGVGIYIKTPPSVYTHPVRHWVGGGHPGGSLPWR